MESICEECLQHSGIEGRMKRAEADVQAIWRSIDSMKAWVIAGMGSMVGTFLVLALNKIF
jgi:hypothetical protein